MTISEYMKQNADRFVFRYAGVIQGRKMYAIQAKDGLPPISDEMFLVDMSGTAYVPSYDENLKILESL